MNAVANHIDSTKVPKAEEPPPYFFSRHIYVCHSPAHTVLLDIRRDKYLAIAGQQAKVLSSRVPDWPGNTVGLPDTSVPDMAQSEAFLKSMCDQAILTVWSDHGKGAKQSSLPEVSSTLVGEYAIPQVKISMPTVARFLAGVAAAAVSLRRFGLESAVRRVEKRRARLALSGPLQLDVAQNAVTVFEILRPLAFKAKNGCLFNSLALVEFLAHEGVYPYWVIGVKTRPFGAHSWVQHGDVVLNDLPERVRKFTPILVA